MGTVTISCYTALCYKLTGYLFTVSFHLNFRKSLAREGIIFMNEKQGGTEMLDMLPMIT